MGMRCAYEISNTKRISKALDVVQFGGRSVAELRTFACDVEIQPFNVFHRSTCSNLSRKRTLQTALLRVRDERVMLVLGPLQFEICTRSVLTQITASLLADAL